MTLQEVQGMIDIDLEFTIESISFETDKSDYTSSLETIRRAEEAKGLHDSENRELRVKWVNNLRRTLERDAPKNKSGTALISDIDLILAPARHRAEAFALSFCKP